MKSNLGSTSRIARIIIATIIAALYFTGTVTGTLATVLLVIGSIMLVTGLISFCPMTMMGICPADLVKKLISKKE